METDSFPRCWIIGSGGQIGRGLGEVIHPARVFNAPDVPWHDARSLPKYFQTTARHFAQFCGTAPWAIVWVAGAAVVGTHQSNADEELQSFIACLDAVQMNMPAGLGTFFLGSSAGGVYAGSAHPPFGVLTEPAPVSPYGNLKLAQERALHARLGGGMSLIAGRIANVYGPTQDLSKAQGLISQLCRGAAMRAPVKIYVPGSTLRDYIYVRDVALTISGLLKESVKQDRSEWLEIIATGQAVSVSSLIGLVQAVTHRRIPVAMGDSPLRGHQPNDLTLTPSPRVQRLLPSPTPLAVGIRRTYESLVTQRLVATRS